MRSNTMVCNPSSGVVGCCPKNVRQWIIPTPQLPLLVAVSFLIFFNSGLAFQPVIILPKSSSSSKSYRRLVVPSGHNAYNWFDPTPYYHHRRACSTTPCTALFLSSRSGGSGGGTRNNDDDNNNDFDESDDIGKFLDPNYRESDNLQRAREFLSDNGLPITADLVIDDAVDVDDNDSEVDGTIENESETDKKESQGVVSIADEADVEMSPSNTSPVSLAGSNPNSLELTQEALERNPYMAVISRLSPSELISRFTSTAHPRVQNAVRQTILGMLGGLPKLAFETTTFTTAQRLASLMFQLQMTGYMFKNAEYRLSLQQSLGDYSSSQYLLSGDEEKLDLVDPRTTKIRGKLRIPLVDSDKNASISSSSSDTATSTLPPALEVDAAAYMGELRQEVAQLRKELETARQAKEEALRKDLLLYIRTLPEQELRSLTNTMSPDVLIAMKGLVNAVLSGIGEEAQEPLTPLTITEQSGEALAQLCMWQLAIGYNLRTLEVREEMKKSIAESPVASSGNISSVDISDGAFE